MGSSRPEELYEVVDPSVLVSHRAADGGASDVPPVLLHSMSGFLDAGAAGAGAVDHLLGSLDHRVVARFDLDPLYDYRARRPRMTFLGDRFGEVDLPELVLREVTDASGRPFLLLHGPEPDLAWVRFVDAVEQLVRDCGVRLTVGLHAVPWPAPHTRPVGVTAHATDPSLVSTHPSWVGHLEVPGHVAGLLELRLGQAGHTAMGFAAHVPHYLAAAEYPSASVALLEHVAVATGLDLPLDALRADAQRTQDEIDAQVRAVPENVSTLQGLEAQYDSFVAQREQLPSGDEIAAQVERFLAERDASGS